MGTHGYIIIKYNGSYYRFFNQFDSYPSVLGQKVIRLIRYDVKCLMIGCDCEGSIGIFCNKDCRDRLYSTSKEKQFFCFIYSLTQEKFEFDGYSDYLDEENLLAWNYLINIDDTTFSIFDYNKKEAVYKLHEIPFNWYRKAELIFDCHDIIPKDPFQEEMEEDENEEIEEDENEEMEEDEMEDVSKYRPRSEEIHDNFDWTRLRRLYRRILI